MRAPSSSTVSNSPPPTCAPSPSNPLPPPAPVISSAPNQASTSRFANSVPLKMTRESNQKPASVPPIRPIKNPIITKTYNVID
jgi:hypothetical protein